MDFIDFMASFHSMFIPVSFSFHIFIPFSKFSWRFHRIFIAFLHGPMASVWPFPLRGLPGAHELRRAQLCSGAVTAGGVLWEFYGDLPAGKLTITMENHHFQWENPLFLWSFSIAMLNYQRVYGSKPTNHVVEGMTINLEVHWGWVLTHIHIISMI